MNDLQIRVSDVSLRHRALGALGLGHSHLEFAFGSLGLGLSLRRACCFRAGTANC